MYKEALDSYSKALDIWLNYFGADHPFVTTCYTNIGTVYLNQGKHHFALENYSESLKINLKIYGPNHPNVAQSYSDIGNAYDHLRKAKEALENHNKSLEIRLRVFGSSSLAVGACFIRSGRCMNTKDFIKTPFRITPSSKDQASISIKSS